MSFFKRIFSGKKKESLDSGLEKTRTNVFQRLAKVFTGRRKVDEELMDDLEEALITADVGVDTANKILDRLRKARAFRGIYGSAGIVRDAAGGNCRPFFRVRNAHTG